ncbi:MAG: type II/IV secretion system protein, partial [Candidatus Omnitrophica bacterium]|nr:type II/IV secretion system protein [Candidatus Omnitrophota bacterium]
IDDIASVTGSSIKLILSTRHDIEEAIGNFFKSGEEDLSAIIEEEEEDVDIEIVGKFQDVDVSEIKKESTAAPIVKMVDLMISEAMKKRASDIHIEPQEGMLKVRYRIDGELHEAFDLPKQNQNAILARLKIMSNMDITESRVPQDGRFRVKFGMKDIDFRVSALPTSFGNKIVLRALDKSNLSVGLDALGFLPEPLADFKTAIARPFGIILVTGPTGSGKSTTLYSVLNQMNTPEKNIVTIEDPVEYQVAGITQIAAHADIGLSFAMGLRAILRQSPDVIMVGEIRDIETADIAIKASLTGQLVLSTLHTNDAIGSITRLANMGVEPFLIASSLIMACAQRLLRRICPNCKTETKISKEVLSEIREKYPQAKDVNKFYIGKGCSKCGKTGYSGRLGTLETLLVTDELREMINRGEPEEKLKAYLKTQGMKTLRDNSMVKFFNGDTTLEEVLRVT